MQTSLESQNGVMWPQSFHDFYDPNGYFGGNGGLLLEYLYAQRQQRLALGHVPQIGGQEIDNPRMQIAIEIGHLALKSNDNVSEWSGLGLNETTLKTAVDIAEADVAQNIAWVHRVVDGLLLVEKVQTRIQEMGD